MTDFSRVSSLALFNEYCQQTGLDSATMLKADKLPADTLANPESLIPYSRFLNLLELCAEKSGNPLFALEYGLYQGVAIFWPSSLSHSKCAHGWGIPAGADALLSSAFQRRLCGI